MRVLRDLSIPIEEVVASREAIVAIGEGEVSGNAAAVLLFADYAVLVEGAASVILSREDGEGSPAQERGGSLAPLGMTHVFAALIWRLGFDAYRLLLSGRTRFTAREALAAGLCDATEWKFENRSAAAFDAGAELIARRGGDRLERAEFARLFATGDPQEGLAAFLGKRRPGFRVA
jgi:hypothetical protein